MKLHARALALLLLAPSVHAADWYVDAQNGNDANDGQSPASAWKTLTHAISSVPTPTGGHTFHVAAGLYDRVNGEQYPLGLYDHMQLVGAGPDVTILSGSATSLLVYQSMSSGSFGNAIEADTIASGMTLRDAAVGIELVSQWNPVQPTFTNLHLTALSTAAATLTAGPAFGSHTVAPNFTSVAVDSCGSGFALHSVPGGSGAFAHVTLSATDVQITGCTGDAISVAGAGSSLQSGATASANLVRCRVNQNAGNGVTLSAVSGGASLSAQSCLFAANHGSGVDASSVGGVPSGPVVALSNCTLASNLAFGLHGPSSAATTISGSIVFGNATDLALTGPLTANSSSSGDAVLIGQPGCIQANPMFVNANDFRLRFGSPCIDVGDPAANGVVDLLGHTRPFDGDLDTHAASDMGAYEFEPLHQFGSTSIGHQFGLEFWGASGSMSQLFLSKQPLTPPQSTPFGDFYLAPGTVIALATVPAQPGPPHFLRRTIPNNPVLIGTTFSFQALTDSVLAPQGQAYTNPTSFVVMP
jgi:hypothetical protein